ncbi:hypothetical protein KLPMCK381M_22420 [Klebsiella pneumoniae]
MSCCNEIKASLRIHSVKTCLLFVTNILILGELHIAANLSLLLPRNLISVALTDVALVAHDLQIGNIEG